MKSLQNDGVSYGKKQFTKNTKKAYRQYNAYLRNERQIKSGIKNVGKLGEIEQVPLTMKDYQRLEREKASLKYKLSQNFSHLFNFDEPEKDELRDKVDASLRASYAYPIN